jgi:alkanesulfonate monooxygenase SsuD/methylene tetrahydromethanopterin reductase-like flavin-dependent oxidoreductase (luciferase family)
MARLRTGTPLTVLDTVEAAAAATMTEPQAEIIDRMRSRWIIGDADEVAERLVAFAARYEVVEVMISPAAGAREQDPIDRVPGRERTIDLLAERLPQTGTPVAADRPAHRDAA